MDDSRRGCDSGSLERARSTRLRRGMCECGSLCAPLSASGPEYWRGAAAPPPTRFALGESYGVGRRAKKRRKKLQKPLAAAPTRTPDIRPPIFTTVFSVYTHRDTPCCGSNHYTFWDPESAMATTAAGLSQLRTHAPAAARAYHSSLRLLVHVSDFV